MFVYVVVGCCLLCVMNGVGVCLWFCVLLSRFVVVVDLLYFRCCAMLLFVRCCLWFVIVLFLMCIALLFVVCC